MRSLKLNTGHGDQITTFSVEHPRWKDLPMTAALCQDYEAVGDGIYWAMQIGACLKASYTQADEDESTRLRSEGPLKNGEVVEIDGAQYVTRILGDFSNCAVFDKI